MADEIRLPAPLLERAGLARLAYRLEAPASGSGEIDIEWTDAAGRLVDRRRQAFTLDAAAEIPFTLDLRRAVVRANDIAVRLDVDERRQDGTISHRNGTAHASFIVRPDRPVWSDYHIIMWQPQELRTWEKLKALGVDSGVVTPLRASPERDPMGLEGVPELLHEDLSWYVENIATDFYSPYHRWFAGRPVNWAFLEAKRRYREDPASATAFLRDPSLSDPQWLERVRQRLGTIVRLQKPFAPLYYSLADEAGIADVSAFWDFDLGESSLAGMRAWLAESYGSLDALNREWGTDYPSWDVVKPLTTTEAMRRTDGNYAAWADFKAWMDVAFARAFAAGSAAVHAADPEALAAFEGGQIPGWGGYDYSLLADAVDAMELYDYGNNIDIVHSFAPRAVLLTTSFGGGAVEAHRVWDSLLRGSRGLVIWDEDHGLAGVDGSLGPRGRALGATFQAIRGGVGQLLISSRPQDSGIALLYSPASFRTQWMLDQRAHGEAWTERNASAEYEDNAVRGSTRRYVWALTHLGLHPRFLSSAMLERGALADGPCRILILPHAIALSGAEIAAIRTFVERGGTLIVDGVPGGYDQHSRRRDRPPLAELFEEHAPGDPETRARFLSLGTVDVAGAPRGEVARSALEELGRIIEHAGAAPAISANPTGGDRQFTTRIYRNGAVEIVVLHSDLRLVGSGQHQRLRPAPPLSLVLQLPGQAYIYNVVPGGLLGFRKRLSLSLDPVTPTILAISPTPLPPPLLTGSKNLPTDRVANFSVTFPTSSAAEQAALRVDVIDPAGRLDRRYSGNLMTAGGKASFPLRLALNDAAGSWTIRVTDVLSGQAAVASVTAPGE